MILNPLIFICFINYGVLFFINCNNLLYYLLHIQLFPISFLHIFVPTKDERFLFIYNERYIGQFSNQWRILKVFIIYLILIGGILIINKYDF